MNTYTLAQELRQRQYDVGLVDSSIIDSLSDEDIIDSYITCSGCGAKQVNPQNLAKAIQLANNANQFLDLCQEFAEVQYKERHLESQRKPPHKANISPLWGTQRNWHRCKHKQG